MLVNLGLCILGIKLVPCFISIIIFLNAHIFVAIEFFKFFMTLLFLITFQVGKSDPSFPIQKKRVSREFLRTKAHLRPRTNTFGAV